MESPQEPPPEGSAPIPPGGPVGSSPAPGEPAPPPPPPPPARRDDTANVGLRVGAAVLALALAIICAVGIAVMVDVSDTGTCDDVADAQRVIGGYECYDFSSSVKPIVLGAGWIGSVLAGIAAFLALAFTIRGRGGRILLATTGVAAFFLAISIIVAQV